MPETTSNDIIIFEFLGKNEDAFINKVRDAGGIYSTRNNLVGGEQIVEIAFYITIPTTVKMITDIIKEVIKSRRVNAKIGENVYENISDERLECILKKEAKKQK